jgi:Na+/proline symporter
MRRTRLLSSVRGRRPAWVWLIGLAFAWGLTIVVLAFTVHDQGSSSDPDQVFHSYTLVHADGPAVLIVIGVPVIISLVLAPLLYLKTTHRSTRAARTARWLAVLSCLFCLAGLLNAGLVMLPQAALAVCAVAIAPLPPDPNDRLVRSRGVVLGLPPSE